MTRDDLRLNRSVQQFFHEAIFKPVDRLQAPIRSGLFTASALVPGSSVLFFASINGLLAFYGNSLPASLNGH